MLDSGEVPKHLTLRMKNFFLLLLLVTSGVLTYAQTCVINGPSTSISWAGTGSITCASGVNAATATTIEIPSGYTVTFDDVADTWSGTNIVLKGTLTITADVTINSSISVEGTGTLNLSKKLSLGTSSTVPSGCNYNVTIKTNGRVDVGSTGTDRLSICGTLLMQGNGSCEDCGGTNSGTCAYTNKPYCEPNAGYFQGPLGYSQTGYNAALPVNIAWFDAKPVEINSHKNDYKVELRWATSMEENFSRFDVERSIDGKEYETLGTVKGSGANRFNVTTNYNFTDIAPLIGFSYYRIKAIDIDETFEYTSLKPISIEGKKDLTVYPNPASTKEINFVSNFYPSETDRVVLRDARGKEVYQSRVVTTRFSIVPSKELSAGIYLLEYHGADWSKTIRIFVANQ